jgi:hypothetical protein
VDRDGEARRQERRRAGGAIRVQMARTERRPPAPDRQQREIEPALAKRGHAVEEVGVAGEVEAPPRAFDQEADRRRRQAAAADRVVGRGRVPTGTSGACRRPVDLDQDGCVADPDEVVAPFGRGWCQASSQCAVSW